MGRDIEYETFNGKPLIAQSNGDTYRVRISKNHKKNKKGKGVDCYILYRNNNKIKVRMELKDAATDFYTETLSTNNLIDVPDDAPVKRTTETIGTVELAIGSGSGDYPTAKTKKVQMLQERVRKALTPDFICAEFMKLLAKDKHKVATLCNMPAFANLEDYMIPVQNSTYSIKQVLQAYIDNEPEPEALRNANAYFGEFAKVCSIFIGKKIKNIDEFTGKSVQYYLKEIYNIATKDAYFPSWLSKVQIKKLKESPAPRHYWHKHRIGMVRGIIRNAISNFIHQPNDPDKKQFDDMLFWTSGTKVKKVKRIKRLPKIISKDDFNKLLQQAIKEKHLTWECMLRVMLNCSFTLSEISTLYKQDINWDEEKLIKNREKVETEIRFAKLHPLTIEVLKRYMKEYPNKTDYIFLNSEGKPIKVKTQRISFNRLKARAGVDKEVQARHMRKTTATAASDYPGITQMHVHLIMGQTSDILQYYQNPTEIEIISNACLYACDKYFGE